MSLGMDVFRQMENLRREMDEILNARPMPRLTSPVFRWSFLPGRAARAYPLLNVAENETHIFVDALAPGLDPDSLKINIAGDQLSISGEKCMLCNEIKPDAYHRNERSAGRFTRIVTLPSPVKDGKAEANYKNGLLSITLPKSEAAKPKQISVKMA